MTESLAVKYKTEKPGVIYQEIPEGFVTYKFDFETDTMSILELYVKPEYRGQGIAVYLIEKVKREAIKANISTLISVIDPNEDTAPALRAIFKTVGLQQEAPIKLEFEFYKQRIN